jgi:hypothetical protein
VQADYEKRLKDVEAQREQLLDEMETRENSLINEVTWHNLVYFCVNYVFIEINFGFCCWCLIQMYYVNFGKTTK